MDTKPSLTASMRRSGARLRAMGKTHSPLHVLLWQTRETQNALLAAATAQKTLFNDIAAWASKENRAINDVCACASELSSIYATAQMQIALAYKSFRKDMKMILEGENRCDSLQKKLQEAEAKRLKLRRQVLRMQSKRTETGENAKHGDLTVLQTQLAQAERMAERLHIESCNASREQEAVKMVIMRSALSKLSESHIALSSQIKLIFEAEREITNEIPEPPPPGDPLNGLLYAGHDVTRVVLERVKSQIQMQLTPAALNFSDTSAFNNQVQQTYTPSASPSSIQAVATAPPAPSQGDEDPPPPYNPGIFRSCCTNGEEGYGTPQGKRSLEEVGHRKRVSARRNLHSRATVTPSPSSSSPSASNITNQCTSDNAYNQLPENPFFVQDAHSSAKNTPTSIVNSFK